VPTTFLTAKPIPVSGVTTNEVKGGVDFSFPSGAENWITLDQNPGTEEYIVVFSKTPLTSPNFLTSKAGAALSDDEQDEWNEFLSQYKANEPETAVTEGNNEPFVSVKIPPAKAGDPVVFGVRIEHK
jgi:hypothetical protein